MSYRKYIAKCLLAAGLIGGVTLFLWFLRDELTLANFSLVYLLSIFISAIYQGTGPSLVASVISFLCINFFLVKPLYTFVVADPHELLDLVIFFAVAILTSQLAAQVRRQADNARQHAHEQDILYKLSSTFNQLTDRDSVYQVLKSILKIELSARNVDMLPGEVEVSASAQTELYLLLQTDSAIYGTLRVTFVQVPIPSLIRLVMACSVQASTALQRIELTERARKAHSYEEADRLKTALLHSVSHDLRTPITIIKTSASNLLELRSSLSESERIESLRTIENEADHLNKMVGNLLDISRLKAGALQMNDDWNDLEEVVGDVAARTWQLTHQERIEIRFPGHMPLVRFDYGLVLQALSNLVENSLRYEPADKKIEIVGNLQEGEARVAVVNHGPNLSLQERKLIWEPFYHGREGNIGLGMAIAKGIIEAHKGRLWVEDTPGGGVTFVFSLPVVGEIYLDQDPHC
jgi:two-component system, OmpR family, sensor histidine kinase KdpD